MVKTWAIAVALLAAPAAAADAPPLPCEGHPEWARAYESLPNYDHTGGEAHEWLQLRGCNPVWDPDSEDWLPNRDCDPVCVRVEEAVTVEAPGGGVTPGSPRAGAEAIARIALMLSAAPVADGSASAPPACDPPTMELTPSQPRVGAAVTVRLLDRGTSEEFEDGPGRTPSWSMAVGAGMTVTEPLGRSGASFQAVSSDSGTATFTVQVCGVSDSASVTWVKPRPWWQSPWLGVAAGAVLGGWHVWPRGEQP